MHPALRIRGLTHSYGEVEAVRGLDLEIDRGEVVALLGPNGAGKTTTVASTIGLFEPDSGDIAVAGMSPRAASVRRRMGIVQQDAGFPRTLKVGEVVRGAARRAGVSDDRAEEALDAMDLSDLAGRRSSALSGGQQQRLQLAMGLVADPVLLVLDEPTAGLDVRSRRRFWTAISERAAGGAGVLLTTHIVGEAAEVAHRVAVIHRGRIIAMGSPADLARELPDRRIEVRTTIAPTALRVVDGVESVSVDDGRTRVVTSRAEDVVRWMLANDPDLTDLTVTTAGLDDVVVSLTQEEAA